MPIYEYYCPNNHTIYQFFAKTLAQGKTVPKCPHNPAFEMRKLVSAFAVTGKSKTEGASPSDGNSAPPGAAEDARMEAAMGAIEREFSNIDENDPRAIGRMMRRMSEMTGEKIEGEMEEVVRRLEEGADPNELEEQFGSEAPDGMGDPEDPFGGPGAEKPSDPKEPRHRFRVRKAAPARDPKLYDYE
jgi:hypothetical protein